MSEKIIDSLTARWGQRFQIDASLRKKLIWLVASQRPHASKMDFNCALDALQVIEDAAGPDNWRRTHFVFKAAIVMILYEHYWAIRWRSASELVAIFPEFFRLSMPEQMQLVEFRNLLSMAVTVFDPTRDLHNLFLLVEMICGFDTPALITPELRGRRALLFARTTNCIGLYANEGSFVRFFPHDLPQEAGVYPPPLANIVIGAAAAPAPAVPSHPPGPATPAVPSGRSGASEQGASPLSKTHTPPTPTPASPQAPQAPPAVQTPPQEPPSPHAQAPLVPQAPQAQATQVTQASQPSHKTAALPVFSPSPRPSTQPPLPRPPPVHALIPTQKATVHAKVSSSENFALLPGFTVQEKTRGNKRTLQYTSTDTNTAQLPNTKTKIVKGTASGNANTNSGTAKAHPSIAVNTRQTNNTSSTSSTNHGSITTSANPTNTINKTNGSTKPAYDMLPPQYTNHATRYTDELRNILHNTQFTPNAPNVQNTHNTNNTHNTSIHNAPHITHNTHNTNSTYPSQSTSMSVHPPALYTTNANPTAYTTTTNNNTNNTSPVYVPPAMNILLLEHLGIAQTKAPSFTNVAQQFNPQFMPQPGTLYNTHANTNPAQYYAPYTPYKPPQAPQAPQPLPMYAPYLLPPPQHHLMQAPQQSATTNTSYQTNATTYPAPANTTYTLPYTTQYTAQYTIPSNAPNNITYTADSTRSAPHSKVITPTTSSYGFDPNSSTSLNSSTTGSRYPNQPTYNTSTPHCGTSATISTSYNTSNSAQYAIVPHNAPVYQYTNIPTTHPTTLPPTTATLTTQHVTTTTPFLNTNFASSNML